MSATIIFAILVWCACTIVSLGIDIYRLRLISRHHDHLIPKTPRSQRG